MARSAWLLALAAATAVAWLQLYGLHWAARAWAVVLLVPFPALMVLQARRLHALEVIPRPQAYISSIVSLWLLALITFAVARLAGYDAAYLGLVAVAPARALALALGITAAAIAVLFLFRFAGVHEPPVVRELLPVSGADRALFVGVSVTAGVCEEIVFRGFLLSALHGATGSMLIALLVSSGAFGIVHAYQQPLGALRAALLGALLAVPVILDGSIIPAIVAHALIDIIAALWLAKYLLR